MKIAQRFALDPSSIHRLTRYALSRRKRANGRLRESSIRQLYRAVLTYAGESVLALACCTLLFPIGAWGITLALSIDDIASADFSARGVTLSLPEDGSADLQIAELHVQQRELRRVHIRCASFALSTAGISCHGGSLAQLPGIIAEFNYLFKTGVWQASAQLHNVSAKQIAVFAAIPQISQGELNGALRLSGDASGLDVLVADVQLADVGFSDASGLHAAEKLQGLIKLSAARKAAFWTWQGNLAWQSGDLFWQPLFLQGGYKLSASGSLEGTSLKIEQAEVDLPQAGRVKLAALVDIKQGALLECRAQGENLALEKLYADYARPFLDKSVLAEASLQGSVDVDWQFRDDATQKLHLKLREVGLNDARQRFALLGLQSEIDWQVDTPRTASISFAGGALLGMPLGAVNLALQMNGLEFSMAQANLPILGGAIELRDFKLHREAGQQGKPCSGCTPNVWHWQFAASLNRVSMEQFSQALGWPKMLGMLAGRIPRVSYEGDEIKVDGALLFDMFNGTVVATQLKLTDPFGLAPRLSGNLNMRDLDLDLLTRTFSFGNMQGRIDVDVNNLELVNWQPTHFDARVFSSAGNYPKKISQKAVQNISALGGAGALVAIQRSYLRFFENFGYDRIGWSCKLRNGVCQMSGVDDGKNGTYAIIKGGGIPAITVMGYNRNVSWDELLNRLKRVTQNNVQPVIK